MENKKSYKELEKELIILKTKNEALSFHIDNSLDVIWEMNTSLVFTYVSPSIYEQLGYTREEWVGKRLSNFCTFKEFVKMARHALGAIKNYKKFNHVIFEADFIHKNGSIVHVEIVGKVSYNKYGLPIGVMGSTRNVTARKKTEKNLIESEIKLKELNASKDKLFSIIAHDLRAPFTAMLGFSGLLHNNFNNYTIDEQKRFVKLIDNKLNDTYKLIENLLVWSQTHRGLIKFSPKKINLFLVISEIIRIYDSIAINKSITVNNEIPTDYSINGDEDILSAIIRNLLSNALKFTPKGGKITLNANIFKNPNNVLTALISVADNGIGIDEKVLKNIFQSNVNISHKGTEEELGSGLGLVLCKELIDLHGGEIKAESTKGEGSKFIISFPIE